MMADSISHVSSSGAAQKGRPATATEFLAQLGQLGLFNQFVFCHVGSDRRIPD